VFLTSYSLRVVLGQFRDSIPDNSILFAIFAGEQDDSSKKSRNRFRLATSPKTKMGKKTSLPDQNWRKKYLKTRILQVGCPKACLKVLTKIVATVFAQNM
jgi:hypothetical protein